MRFLIVTPLLPPEPGGPSYYAVGLRGAFERAGHTASILAFREVRRYVSGVRHLLFLYKALWAARHVDTLIILDTVSVALPAVLAGWVLGKRTVLRTGGDFVWERYVERTGELVRLSAFYQAPRSLSWKERLLVVLQRHIVFRLVTTIVYSSRWQRDAWRVPYHIPDSKTAVIENTYPEKTNDAVGGGTYLCAWRPTGFKNIPTLERAYALARERDPRVTLDLLKGVPREEVQGRMRIARALVIPSLSEVSPNLAMEALAMGLPVILTEECGTRERFGDAVTWVNPNDPESIAVALVALMDPEQYARARERAQAFAFTRSYDDIAREFAACSEAGATTSTV